MAQSEQASGLIDFLYGVTSALKYGFSATVSAGPGLSSLTIQPTQQQQQTSLLPLLLIGGAGLVLLLVILGD